MLRNGYHHIICKVYSIRLLSTKQDDLKCTKLNDFHIRNEGKMVPFAGWSMPVQYKDLSIIESHHHTRNACSLFDVSHMLQFKLHGNDRVKLIERLVVADVAELENGTGTLSLIMNESGGIRDDCIINNAGDHLYVVSNAGCAEKIKPLIEAHVTEMKNSHDVSLEFLDCMSLIALQGPKSAETLQQAVNADLAKLKFMNGLNGEIFGVSNCRITRCGYTGEDGFELSIPSDRVEYVAEHLLNNAHVKLAGLGARDTLRLEAGLCLYGNDIDETTTPVEAMLMWTVGKRRRKAADFPGGDIVMRQFKEKTAEKKRVGIISTGPPIRGHVPVIKNGEIVGETTSGCPSPSVQKNIAMAYVRTDLANPGTELLLKRGKKEITAEIVKMPFHPTKYFV